MYHLFSGANYYPDSGLGDYISSYDDLGEAEEEGRSLIEGRRDWFSIITEQDKKLVELTYDWRR